MKLLITAGPTREPIDPVRFLSNRSSGKMGYAIAQAALRAGHKVILISGPVCLRAPANARVIQVTTSDEMFEAVHAHVRGVDAAVMCAAVADFKPAAYTPRKIKKHEGLTQLRLKPTRDILSSLAQFQKKILIIGFAAETESLRANAQKKLRAKKCDLIIGNDVSRMDTGLESDENKLILFFRNGETRRFPRATKAQLARKLVEIFEELEEKR